MKHLIVGTIVKMPVSNNEVKQLQIDSKLTLLLDEIEKELKSNAYDTCILFPSIRDAVDELIFLLNAGYNPTTAQEVVLSNFEWCIQELKKLCKTRQTRMILFPIAPNPLFLQNSTLYNFDSLKERTVKNTFIKINLLIRDINQKHDVHTSEFFYLLYRQKRQLNANVKVIRTSLFTKSGSIKRKTHRTLMYNMRKALNSYRVSSFILEQKRSPEAEKMK